jgi:hypothetical protein
VKVSGKEDKLYEKREPEISKMGDEQHNQTAEAMVAKNPKVAAKQGYLRRHKSLPKELVLDGGIYMFEKIVEKMGWAIKLMKEQQPGDETIAIDWERVEEKRGWILPKAFIIRVLDLQGINEVKELSKRDIDILNSFEDNVKFDVLIKCFFYLPGCCLLGLTHIPEEQLMIHDSFPAFVLCIEDSF